MFTERGKCGDDYQSIIHVSLLTNIEEKFSISKVRGDKKQISFPKINSLVWKELIHSSASRQCNIQIDRFFCSFPKKDIPAFLNLAFQSLTVPILRKYFLRFNLNPFPCNGRSLLSSTDSKNSCLAPCQSHHSMFLFSGEETALGICWLAHHHPAGAQIWTPGSSQDKLLCIMGVLFSQDSKIITNDLWG